VDLTAREWVDLLSEERLPSDERVVIVTTFRNVLRIKKDQWQEHFARFGGIGFKNGKEIGIVSASRGGPQAKIPEWATKRLAVGSADALCVTERRGRYYLKKLTLTERCSEVPGCTVVDSFAPTAVTRTYSIRSDLSKITDAGLQRLLRQMSPFRYDPVAPFKEVRGRVGFLARRELLGGWTPSDKAAIRTYKEELTADQQDNGSWEDSTVCTAFRLIRLIEVGSTINDQPVAKGVAWLLSAAEPLGFPGLFMFSQKATDRFNNWKRSHSGKVRGSARSPRSAVQLFLHNRDILGTPYVLCELRLTWASAIAVEALLRCGLATEPRVIRAINTLLSMRRGERWCGCNNFVAAVDHPDSSEAIDFVRFPVITRNPRPNAMWQIDWPTGREDILTRTSDGRHRHLALGRDSALLMRNPCRGWGDCSYIVHRALSWHPAYHGSNLEMMAALECEYRQGWDGSWTENSVSFMLSVLERFDCPLSAFVVLRTVPRLVRLQRPDGFWHDVRPRPSDEPIPDTSSPPSAKEAGTYMILRSLKTFDFLESLLS
jgi:hypothetical protein